MTKLEKISDISKNLDLPQCNPQIKIENSKEKGFVFSLKYWLQRKLGKNYNKLRTLLGPVAITRQSKTEINKLLNLYDKKNVILNLGSGANILFGREDLINIDLMKLPGVDIQASAENLPIKDQSCDLVFNMSMLEHVKNPKKVLVETHRVLKPNGITCCYIPFLQPFHAAPNDFHRWTEPGLYEFFKDFKQVNILIGAGPTCALNWILIEWLSLFFSFGLPKLKDLLFMIFMVLFSPFRLLDHYTSRLPQAKSMASAFFIVAKK